MRISEAFFSEHEYHDGQTSVVHECGDSVLFHRERSLAVLTQGRLLFRRPKDGAEAWILRTLGVDANLQANGKVTLADGFMGECGEVTVTRVCWRA